MSEESQSYSDVIIQHLIKHLPDSKEEEVLEVTDTPQLRIFPLSTKTLLWYKWSNVLSHTPSHFSYIVNVVEKLQNPQSFLDMLKQTSIRGYIQGASPIWECIREKDTAYKGHLLNRWVLWVEEQTNTLHVLPKYTFFEYISFAQAFHDDMVKLVEVYPHYRSIYYTWSPSKPLNYIIYEQGINFDAQKDYPIVLTRAIEQSIKSANKFLNHINMETSIFKDNDPISESPEA